MTFSSQFSLANAAGLPLALFAVATMAVVPAMAANRGPRLHAATHPVGHFVEPRSYPAHERGHHSARVEPVEDKHAKHGKKMPAGRADLPEGKSHAKSSKSARHKQRDDEAEDYPVMHRASAHGHKLTKRERAEELAEERYDAEQQRKHKLHPMPFFAKGPVREPEPAETRAVASSREPDDSSYASREFTASYDNVARAVDHATRPNAYTRRAQKGVQTTNALHSSPTPQAQNQRIAPAGDPVADEARRSSVVVQRPGPPAQISANDAPMPSPQHYQPRVATGFGAEVAPLPTASRRATNESALSAEAQDLGEDLAVDGVPSARTLANDAMQPLVTPMYTREGNLMMPTPLRGSHEILVHQNVMADHDGLERIRDDYQLNRLRADHQLVGFPESASLRVNDALPDNRRVARPWTVQFAADTARAFFQHFGEPITVTSAVRTVSYQVRLQRVNGNAAATSGEGASPHLTGQAIDLAKRGMTSEEIAWMRTYLLPFIDSGKIDVEEEFQQACFHISVYRAYMPAVRRQAVQVAQYRALPATPATALPESVDTDR